MNQVILVAVILLGLFVNGCAVTTTPLTKDDVIKRITSDKAAMYKNQEAVRAPVSLEDAMARGIKYNLDHRVKLMEDALALRQVSLMTYDMLPRLVAAAGYTERDSYNASSSMNVENFQQSLVPSTSQDKGHYSGDLTLTWNLLDFGVSYFQAKQQADRSHIMKERRRKVVHTIMQQIRQAYWLALGAQQLEGRFEPLLKGVEKALQDSSSIEQEKLRSPMETLTYRKTLLEIMKQLEAFRDELAQAKPRLASLMNFPLDQSFTLAVPSKLEVPDLPVKVEQLEFFAMSMRPELIEADYNERISAYETKKAIARMLPGMEMTVGGHFDSTSFLVSQKWVEGGARLTWNLLNLISGPSQYKIAENQIEIAQAQRLALSMAVLTQVHVSYQDFFSRKRQYQLSAQLQDVDSRIYQQTMNQTKSGSQNQLNEIKSATAALMAEYRSYQNYAALQNACGQIESSIGMDPLPDTVSSHAVEALAEAILIKRRTEGTLCVPESNAPVAIVKPAVVVAEAKPVPAEPVSPTLTVALNPASIISGQSTRLTWSATDVDNCTIQPAIGAVQPGGEQVVSPAETTTYVVKCGGPGGVISKKATLVVNPAAAPEIIETQPKASSPAPCETITLSVNFDTARSQVKPQYHAELKKLADYLKENPDATGEISGHTDSVHMNSKSKIDNMMLSQRRADAIRNYLITNFSIDPSRITAKGYGQTRPVATNNTPEGRQKNRRIEVTFTCGK